MTSKFLLASDFDQTLSFNDSGVVLSELIGFHSFHDKVKGLADINLVQQGAELSYLILHDPDFRRVRLEHIIYLGDGSSDLPVMMHVNQHDGLTSAVSEAKFISRVAKRTVLSANAMSVLVPVLERIMNWNSAEIRRFLRSHGLTLLEWDRMRTDILTIQDSAAQVTTLSDDNAAFDLARLRQRAMSGASADRPIGGVTR